MLHSVMDYVIKLQLEPHPRDHVPVVEIHFSVFVRSVFVAYFSSAATFYLCSKVVFRTTQCVAGV